MNLTIILFLIQAIIFASHKRWAMTFFAGTGIIAYYLSIPGLLNIFSSTIVCIAICLITAVWLYKSKSKDTFCQLILLLTILLCLGALLYDQAMGTNLIYTVYTPAFIGIQLAQLASLNGGISDYINNFVLNLVSNNASCGDDTNRDNGGKTC